MCYLKPSRPPTYSQNDFEFRFARTKAGEKMMPGETKPPELTPIISMWQPWANWVLLGWKPIETRTHNRFRSLVGKRIGIHAAIKWDKDWLLRAREFLTVEQIRRTEQFVNVGGALICTAFVEKERALTAEDSAGALIECVTPRRGLFLRDIQRIETMPMNGRQGIWYANLRGE